MKVKCKICGQVVNNRNKPSFKAPNRRNHRQQSPFPKTHINPETNDVCHGFFEEGTFVDV